MGAVARPLLVASGSPRPAGRDLGAGPPAGLGLAVRPVPSSGWLARAECRLEAGRRAPRCGRLGPRRSACSPHPDPVSGPRRPRDPDDPAPAPGARTPLPAGGTPGAPPRPGSMGARPAGLGLRDWGPRPPWRSGRIYSLAVTAAPAERQASQLLLGFPSRG